MAATERWSSLEAEGGVSGRASERYRELRKLGVTVRKTSDVIIGSFCIDAGLPLLYTDRDFDAMVRHLAAAPAVVAR